MAAAQPPVAAPLKRAMAAALPKRAMAAALPKRAMAAALLKRAAAAPLLKRATAAAQARGLVQHLVAQAQVAAAPAFPIRAIQTLGRQAPMRSAISKT